MENTQDIKPGWAERIALGLFFIVVGGAIIIVFKPWGPQMIQDRVDNYLWRIGVSLGLLVVALLGRHFEGTRKYWQIVFALFTLSTACLLSWVVGNFWFHTLDLSDTTPADWALSKLNDMFVIISVVVVFTLLSGERLGSIYLQKGKLKIGLLIGGIAFLVAAGGSVPVSSLLFKGTGLTLTRILPWLPWLLLTALCNGALEEVLYRGLFLRKLEPFFGKFIANLLIALVFTVLHQGSSYTSDQYIFLLATFPAALAWGWLMQKSEGVWGSILFHAGMDIPIFLGIFANLP